MKTQRDMLLDKANKLAQREHLGGLSLRFVRELLEDDPKYGSAAQARKASEPLTQDDQPPIYAIAWYETSTYGNCAISTGDGKVLAVDYGGMVDMHPVESPVLGRYLGWSMNIGRKEN